jgi:hypothetical protein
MKWLLLIAMFFSLSVSAKEDFSILEELEGKWVGKWDDKYGLKFEISRDGDVFDIKYFIEEDLGKPYKELHFQGEPINRNSIMAGKLLFVVSLEAKNHVTVVGMFDPGTRISKLKKQ